MQLWQCEVGVEEQLGRPQGVDSDPEPSRNTWAWEPAGETGFLELPKNRARNLELGVVCVFAELICHVLPSLDSKIDMRLKVQCQ